ncbi:hypothetical protein HZB01_03915 [Candidatus Woesearchaeota archaeon]|nr:hypothetical protein [Candidatus Woesearchaeota archaeon]
MLGFPKEKKVKKKSVRKKQSFARRHPRLTLILAAAALSAVGYEAWRVQEHTTAIEMQRI